MEDVDELEVIRRERVVVAERNGGDGACGRVGKGYWVLLGGERERGDDNRGQSGGDISSPGKVWGVIDALR